VESSPFRWDGFGAGVRRTKVGEAFAWTGYGKEKIVGGAAVGENGVEDCELAADGQKWKVQEFKIQ